MSKFPENNLPITVLVKYVRDPVDAEYIARGWGMSTDDRKELVFLCEYVDTNLPVDAIKRLVATGKMTEQNAVNLLAAQDRWEDYRELRAWDRPQFPLDGAKVMAVLNISPGPLVGQNLTAARAIWAASGFEMSADELINALTMGSLMPIQKAND